MKRERTALFRSLISSLVLKERIILSEAKAKAIKADVDKLVTKALKGGNSSAKIVAQGMYPNAIEKFVTDVAPRFKDRKGGYTRIIRLGSRLGDQSQEVMLEWVEKAKAVVAVEPVKKAAKEKKVEVKKEAKKVVKKTATKKAVAKKK
jgi:large subunit ribosomal protein L17